MATTATSNQIKHTPSGSIINNLKSKKDLLEFIESKIKTKHKSHCIYYQNGEVYVKLERIAENKLPYSLYEGLWKAT